MRERLIRWRNRLLADPRFQAFAAAFPLTRPIARARARALFDLATGYVASRVLETCVTLDLFSALAKAPMTAAELAEFADLPETSAEVLLKAAAAYGLVEQCGQGRYALGELGAAVLGNGGLADIILHHRLLYKDLGDTLGLLRRGAGQGGMRGYWPYEAAAAVDPDSAAAVERYSTLMARSQAMVAGHVLATGALKPARRLLDVGGGEGVFLKAALEADTRLTGAVFDLPVVAERARQRLGSGQFAGRAGAIGGSFRTDPLPDGFDTISLIRVLHDHDDPVAVDLLAAVRRALPPRGRLVLAEPMGDTTGALPMSDAYFPLYFRAMGSGRMRSIGELCRMAEAAGFASALELPSRMPIIVRVMVARA